MTHAEFLSAPVWLVTDERSRPSAIRTESEFDLDLLPDDWSVQKSTRAEALAAIVAEDGRRRAAR